MEIEKIKVLHIGKFYPVYGGVEKVMYDLCDGLSKLEIQSDFLGVNADAQKSEIIDVNSYFRVYAMASSKKIASTYLSLGFISELRKIKNNYTIIHIHHPDPMACLALKLSGFKGKVVCHWHSDIVKQKLLLKLYKPLQTWMLNRAQQIITTSPNYKLSSIFLERYLDKTTVVPIGIPKVKYNLSLEIENNIKKLSNGRKIVFSLGRLIYYKGYDVLIEAANKLPDYCFLIGGKGPLKKELENKVIELNMSDRFYFLDRIEDKDIPTYFLNCNLFCLPSIAKSEAFGIVLLEAMAYKKPIVATNIQGSGTGWVNMDGVSGLNANPSNPMDLAEKIQNILSNESLEATYGNGAFLRYESEFTQEKMVNSVLEIYKKL